MDFNFFLINIITIVLWMITILIGAYSFIYYLVLPVKYEDYASILRGPLGNAPIFLLILLFFGISLIVGALLQFRNIWSYLTIVFIITTTTIILILIQNAFKKRIHEMIYDRWKLIED